MTIRLTKKVALLDLDELAEAERIGAFAVRRRGKNLGARMTRGGLTTAQLRVVKSAASAVAKSLRRMKGPLRVGHTRFELLEEGKNDALVIHGL